MNLAPASLFMIGLLAAALIFLLYQVASAWTSPRDTGPPTIPADLTIKPRPFLTTAEAAFYNMIRLAVEDEYLVFPHVPLTGVLQLIGEKDRVSGSLVPLLHSVRVDFVLVHPGSLQAIQVIEFDEDSTTRMDRMDRTKGQGLRDGLIEDLCKRAGIPLVHIKADEADTVPKLAARLGTHEPED